MLIILHLTSDSTNAYHQIQNMSTEQDTYILYMLETNLPQNALSLTKED